MIAKIEMIGPFDSHPDVSHMLIASDRFSYREDRGISDIETVMNVAGFNFSMYNHFYQFLPISRTGFEVLDSGCGEGIASRDMKEIGRRTSRKVNITGITMAKRNILVAQYNVDRLLVGSLQESFRWRMVREGQFRFILDFFGPIWDSHAPKDETIPTYAKLLADKGTALLIIRELGHEGRLKKNMVELLGDSGLDIIRNKNIFALVQKRA